MTYRGQEILEGLSDDKREVQQREHPGERVTAGLGNAVPVATLVVFRATSGGYIGAVLRHLTLLGSEKVRAGVIRPIWDEPEAQHRDHDAHNSWTE